MQKNGKTWKYLVTFLIIPFIFSSCNNQHQQNINTTNNEKLVQQYFEHFNKHDWAKMAKMYTETAEFKDPALGQGMVKQTHQQIVQKYEELNQLFPDVKDKVLTMYPAGDKHFIVEFISTGTAPDGSKFELPICTIFTFENGLISKDFTYYDNFEE